MSENIDISNLQNLKLHGLKDPIFADKIESINIHIDVKFNNCGARIFFADGNTNATHYLNDNDLKTLFTKLDELIKELGNKKP